MAKINLKRGLTDIVLYMIIFIVVQIIVMYAGAGIWAGIKGEGYQDSIETMGCSKVDVTAYIGIVGRMLARWLGMYIVGSIQLHGRIIMGISPLSLT